MAVETKTKKIVAVGSEAKSMLGKTPASITALRPIVDGVIGEYSLSVAMLTAYMKKISNGVFSGRPKVVVCIPRGVTEVERRAVEDAAMAAGARSVALIDEPVAAAIGAGLKVKSSKGHLIVDIGGGTTEIALLSMGEVVASQTLKTAGDEFDAAIVGYIRRRFNVLIGEFTAELVKKNIGQVYKEPDSASMEIYGRNLYTGLPAAITLTGSDLREALYEPICEVVAAIKAVLEKTPPELTADLHEHGILVCGGGALLKGIRMLIFEETGVKVEIAQRPLDCVSEGLGIVLENLGEMAGFLQVAHRK